MVTMHRLFVYGTLRHPPLIEGLVGAPVPARDAILAGHRAAPMRGRAYPGLVVDVASDAVGALVEVDDAGLSVLDRFEGPEYTRTPVVVRVVDGADVDAETYLLTGPSRELAEDGTWSLDTFVARDAATWVRGAAPGSRHPTDRPGPDLY